VGATGRILIPPPLKKGPFEEEKRGEERGEKRESPSEIFAGKKGFSLASRSLRKRVTLKKGENDDQEKLRS